MIENLEKKIINNLDSSLYLRLFVYKELDLP